MAAAVESGTRTRLIDFAASFEHAWGVSDEVEVVVVAWTGTCDSVRL